jgi:hypothetical protein
MRGYEVFRVDTERDQRRGRLELGETRTAIPQNGQNEPHYHRKGTRAILRLTRYERRHSFFG